MQLRRMAFIVPKTEPTQAIAGDRWQWSRTFAEFPAGDWTLTYYLRGTGAGAQVDIAATSDGDDFSIDVPPDTTAGYVPGVYYWSAFVSQTGDRKLVGQGRIEVKQNPADITGPVDGRSQNRRIYDAICAVIEDRATTDHQQYVIMGRSITRMPIDDLLKFRDYYAGLVNSEEATTSGSVNRKNILVRFNL